MQRLVLLLALLSNALPSSAFERADLSGLRVHVETIGDPLHVDGVPMRIQRADGPDVPTLARRIEQRWRRDGGEVRILQQTRWQAISRWKDGTSELIQWRETGPVSELLHSTLDIAEFAEAARPPFALPAGCAWGRTIEGQSGHHAFEQHSAFCNHRLASVIPRVEAGLDGQGWTLRRLANSTLDVQRAEVRGTLSISPSGTGCALVWIGLRATSRRGQ